MSTELSTEPSASDVISLLKGQSSKYATSDALATVTKAGDFIPYIQLMGSNSELVKKGKFPMAHFALMKNKQPIDLTSSFVALLMSWRPKAMWYKPKVKSFFDTQSQAFKDTEEACKIPNSNKGYGPEFLIWLPDQDAIATFFMGNISGRMESPNFISCLENGTRVCKIVSHLIEKKNSDQSWHAPKMETYDLTINYPSMDRIKDILDKFNNPPAVEEEVDKDTEERG